MEPDSKKIDELVRRIVEIAHPLRNYSLRFLLPAVRWDRIAIWMCW